MNYDRILKWVNRNDCLTCMGQGHCTSWKIECTGKSGGCGRGKYYVNAAQLEGLIKEAKSGGHKWVRDNTKFVCDNACQCDRDGCPSKMPKNFIYRTCNSIHCFSHNKSISIIPFRGTKTEDEATWPGKTGATHLEALKDLRERGLISGGTEEDCSEVESYMNAWAKSFNSDLEEMKDNLIETFKQDRSDTNYNEKKEALKKAGENALKEESEEWQLKGYEKALCMHCPKTDHGEIDMDQELANYADCLRDMCDVAETYKKDVEDSEDMDVEYVVSRRDFTMKEMASTSINGDIFKYLLCKFGINWGWTKGVVFIDADNVSTEAIAELLRMGFIEQKVCDPVVSMGDCFKIGHNIVRVCLVSNTQYQLISAIDGNRFTDITVEPKDGKMKLSEFLEIPLTLKDFTPCKVEINIIEG